MSNIIKKIGEYVGLFAVVVVAVLIGNSMNDKATVGGNFNPVKVDFAQGISVNGVNVLSSTRELTTITPVTTLTSDTTVTTAQSGTVFNIGTAGVDVTLPAPTAATGTHYRFVVSGTFATTAMTIVAGTADTIEGSLIVAGAVVACDSADLISIAATSEDIGDFVDVYSNGTNWLIGANQAMTASQHTCSG